MQFNVNDSVRVKLNDRGVKILRERHDELRKRLPSVGNFTLPAVDENGWSKFQLWDLMRIFGPHISLGMVTPFDTTIEIPEPAPKPQPIDTSDLSNFGWAPGGYSVVCLDCPKGSTVGLGRVDHRGLAAKRSWRCRQHAEQARDQHIAKQEKSQ